MVSVDSEGNQPFVRLANETSESITGTSIRTPTTVAKAAPEPSKFKEVGCADHCGWCGHVKRESQRSGGGIADREDAVALDEKRNSDH